MRKFKKLVTAVAFLLGTALAEEAEAEPLPIFNSEFFKVYNLTEEYVESEDQYYWKDVDKDPNITSILSNKTVIEFSN